jgi:hypothetical protein
MRAQRATATARLLQRSLAGGQPKLDRPSAAVFGHAGQSADIFEVAAVCSAEGVIRIRLKEHYFMINASGIEQQLEVKARIIGRPTLVVAKGLYVDQAPPGAVVFD